MAEGSLVAVLLVCLLSVQLGSCLRKYLCFRLALDVFSCVVCVPCSVGLRLRNQEYYSNGVIDLNSIGEGDDALLCTTDLSGCCQTVRTGEWVYPNGSVVPAGTTGYSMYRNRGNRYIRLNRRNDALAEGMFCCRLQDSTRVEQNLCAHLYSRGKHNDQSYSKHVILISSHSFLLVFPPLDSPPVLLADPVDQLEVTPGDEVSFSVSVVGFALTYRWQLIDGTQLPANDQRLIGINSANLTIRVVIGRDIGIYQCIVSNAAGIVASTGALLTVGEL